MNPGIRRIGTQNMYYRKSDQDSNITLVFVPGGFNPDIWRHQIRYFSKKYNTVVFEPVNSRKNLQGEVEALESILSQPEIENAVLVSNLLGNQIVNRFEDNENVMATIYTGNADLNVSRPVYRYAWKAGLKKPKMLKKIFFSDDTDYKVVKDFSGDVNPPDYSQFQTYTGGERVKTDTPSITIHGSDDRFSSLEKTREMYPEDAIRMIDRAGAFSFYEKPQEYNKVLNDFLAKLEDFMEKKELVAAKSKNRSLKEFSRKQEQKQAKMVEK